MKNLKLVLPLLALVLAIGVVFTTSAFKGNEKPQKRALAYFQYTGSTFDETSYRNIGNWEHITDVEAPGCGGEGRICVLQVENSNLTATGSMIQKLDDYLNVQLDDPGQVATFVENPANAQAQQN